MEFEKPAPVIMDAPMTTEEHKRRIEKIEHTTKNLHLLELRT